MAGSGSFDRGPINGQGGEATWQPVERSIARGFKAVDLHLSEGVCGEIKFIGWHYNLSH